MHPKLLYGTGLCKKKDLACFEKLVSVHTIMRGHRFLFSYPAQRRRGERGVRARTSEGQFEKPVSVHNVMRGHQFLKVEKSVFPNGISHGISHGNIPWDIGKQVLTFVDPSKQLRD